MKLYGNSANKQGTSERNGEVLAWVRSWEFCLKPAAASCHLCDKTHAVKGAEP